MQFWHYDYEFYCFDYTDIVAEIITITITIAALLLLLLRLP